MIVDITIGFTILLIFALVVTAIYTIWARVPFVPTPKKTVNAMLDIAKLKGDEVVYDLGAGDGSLLIRAKRRHPGIRAIGYELVPFVWFLGILRKFFSRSKIELKWGNALKANVSDADCIFLYLITSVMPKFKAKFDRELKPGTKVISHVFHIPGKEPIGKYNVSGLLGKGVVYYYEW